MRIALVVVTMLVTATNATAQDWSRWKRIGTGNEGQMYIDPESMFRPGFDAYGKPGTSFARAVVALDLSKRLAASNGRSYRSSATLTQFDCATMQVKPLKVETFSERGLQGEEVSKVIVNVPVQSVTANSNFDRALQFVCSNTK